MFTKIYLLIVPVAQRAMAPLHYVKYVEKDWLQLYRWPVTAARLKAVKLCPRRLGTAGM